MSSTHKYFLAIDYGTATIQVSYINEAGRAQPVRLPDGGTTMLSVVYFDENDQPIFGQEAENLRLLNPSRGVAFSKRHMGTDQVLITVAGKPYTAEDIGALLLEYVKDCVEKELNRVIPKLSLAVPANVTDAAKAASIRMAKEAGFEEDVVKHEPTAALCFRLYDPDKEVADGIYAVFDIGGGTTDYTVMERKGGEITVKTTSGVSELGGVDYTQAIVDHCLAQAAEQGVVIPEDGLEDRAVLWRNCEEAKHRLNRSDKVTVIVAHDGSRVPVELTKDVVRGLWRPLNDQLIACQDKALEEAGVTKEQLNELIPVGGGSECFFVLEELEAFFGRKLSEHGERIQAVANGAALLGWEHFKGALVAPNLVLSPRFLSKDVTAHALGVMALNEEHAPVFAVVLEKGVPMGSTHRRVFDLSEPGATTVAVEVIQGQPGTDVEACTDLGRFELTGLPPIHGRPHKIELVFTVDANGMVTATARDTESHQIGDLQVSYDRELAA